MPIRYVETTPECIGCASCCRNLFVAVTKDDVEAHPSLIRHTRELQPGDPDDLNPAETRGMKHRSDGTCVGLDPETNACTIYESRPQVCRDFERGSSPCWQAVRNQLGLEKFLAPAV